VATVATVAVSGATEEIELSIGVDLEGHDHLVTSRGIRETEEATVARRETSKETHTSQEGQMVAGESLIVGHHRLQSRLAGLCHVQGHLRDSAHRHEEGALHHTHAPR
jgi:hypothetical protein